MPIRFVQKDSSILHTAEAYGREKLTAEEAKNLVAQIAARQQSRRFNDMQVTRHGRASFKSCYCFRRKKKPGCLDGYIGDYTGLYYLLGYRD